MLKARQNHPTLHDHLSPKNKPKRILALDGGGVRGLMTLQMLKHIHGILAPRHRHMKDFHLCDYFDLIAGTSTGAIIAACLAIRKPIEEITRLYEEIIHTIFRSRWYTLGGALIPKFSNKPLENALKLTLGEDIKLGGPEIRTGLLLMTKRFDTTSPWPITNNPKGTFYEHVTGQKWIANSHFPLWKVVRASTAAPSFFKSEKIEVDRIEKEDETLIESGIFLDGGVSPHNNPALMAFLVATLDGFKLQWKASSESLFLVSLGTGRANPERKPSKWSGKQAVEALISLMDDCSVLNEIILQGISQSTTAREIDSEMGDLKNDLICGKPVLSYVRYDVEFNSDWMHKNLDMRLDEKKLKKVEKMDRTDTKKELVGIGVQASRKLIHASHFPKQFDLK